MVVYLDKVFFLNVAVDFLLLSAANCLTGYPSSILRSGLASLLGGLYAAGCLLPQTSFLRSPAAWIGCLLVICLIAFGWSASTYKRGVVFFLLSMALGGLAHCIGRGDLPQMLVCGGLLWGLCALNFGIAGGQTYCRLKLTLGEKSVSMLALQDTGNSLRDPVSGECVVVISPQAAFRLTGLTREQLRQPIQTLSQGPIPGLRLIPYRSVGSAGMLLGLRIRDGELDGKRKSLLVAFAPEGLGNGEVYQALTGGAL